MTGMPDVIWDWNGTLLDDVALSLDIVNGLLVELRVAPLSTERYREIFDFPPSRYWSRAGVDLRQVNFEEISLEFCRRFEDRLGEADLFPDTTSTLDSLSRAGLTQFLVSATEHERLHRMLCRYGLDRAFDAFQGLSDTLGLGKPGAVERLLEDCELAPDETLLVGDTVHEAEMARELGVACILVASGHQARHRLVRPGYLVVDSLEELASELPRGPGH